VVWKVPLGTTVKPSLVVRAPKAGYLVPPAWAGLVADKLALHGIKTFPVTQARSALAVEVFRATDAKFAADSYEGRQRVAVTGTWSRATRDVPAGSLFVPVAQPAARLLVHLLEPQAPDALVAWGYFNAVFEQKEYMEAYVAEELAAAMLRDDPALRAAFDEALASDPAFAANPARRLDFFYRRSPYWDARKNVVPILRVDAF
jgi:hypothetical protein